MPTRFGRATARRGDDWAVHPERDDGRPTHGRRPLDARPVRAPREVLVPPIHPWVEERHRLSRERIASVRSVALELVAWPAGAAHVLERRPPTLRSRFDMIVSQGYPGVGL